MICHTAISKNISARTLVIFMQTLDLEVSTISLFHIVYFIAVTSALIRINHVINFGYRYHSVIGSVLVVVRTPDSQ